jgi:ribonuclease Z
MKPLFHPILLNHPFGDPVLYIEILHEKNALLFDMGDLSSLRPAKLLKTSQAFVSHTHIDHFIGFDHLLRIMLAREKKLILHGPPGILSNIKGKLGGYTWNLVQDYPFSLEVCEIHQERILRSVFACKNGLKEERCDEVSFSGTLEENPHYTVGAVHLDHRIPCLAFVLKEQFHINIKRDALERVGLATGPWWRRLEQAIWEGMEDDVPIEALYGRDEERLSGATPLGELKKKLVTVTAGQKIVYVPDCRYTEENVAKIVTLSKEADLLFCEAAFLDEDRARAAVKAHLTARQAGLIAREAGVKSLRVFHFSPRYEDRPESLVREAEEAFAQG